MDQNHVNLRKYGIILCFAAVLPTQSHSEMGEYRDKHLDALGEFVGLHIDEISSVLVPGLDWRY